MINTDMFRRIGNQIRLHPETHNQGYFESANLCGTTRCVAGWAIHFMALDRGYDVETSDLDQLAARYAQENHLRVGDGEEASDGEFIEAAAAHILGIDEDTATSVFYQMDARVAADWVDVFAAGRIPADLDPDLED